MAINFQKFIDNITLTDAQWDDAKKKYEGVCRCLDQHFYDIQQFCASLLMPMELVIVHISMSVFPEMYHLSSLKIDVYNNMLQQLT